VPSNWQDQQQAPVDTGHCNLYSWGMDVIAIKPERKAQLEAYAQRQGQDPAVALDDLLSEFLEWEQQDYREAVEGIRRGYADYRAGRLRPAAEIFQKLREKHGLPR